MGPAGRQGPLVRWHRPGHGLVPPDRFVSVLEDTGLILPVGAWVIRAACEQIAAWDRLGLPPLRLAVNLSARQFRHLYLASMIEDSLRQNGIEPQRLEIELTESLLMEDNDATRSMLESFRRLGVRMAIDDFGTGHSSLSYIRRFAIDTLKIIVGTERLGNASTSQFNPPFSNRLPGPITRPSASRLIS